LVSAVFSCFLGRLRRGGDRLDLLGSFGGATAGAIFSAGFGAATIRDLLDGQAA
jgi:hypothetical protein